MRSILFLKQTIQGSQFKWYFLKNKNFFQDFFLNVWNKVKILNIFKKKDGPHSWRISEITDSEKRF